MAWRAEAPDGSAQRPRRQAAPERHDKPEVDPRSAARSAACHAPRRCVPIRFDSIAVHPPGTGRGFPSTMPGSAEPRRIRSERELQCLTAQEPRRRTLRLGAASPAATLNRLTIRDERMRRRPTPKVRGAGAPCETHNPQEEAWGRGVVRAVLQPRYLHGTRLDTTCQLAQTHQESDAVRLTLAGRCGARDGRALVGKVAGQSNRRLEELRASRCRLATPGWTPLGAVRRRA